MGQETASMAHNHTASGDITPSPGFSVLVASKHPAVNRLLDGTSFSLEPSDESECFRPGLGKYSCIICGKLFSFPGNRSRHEKMCQQVSCLVPCQLCDQAFARSDNLKTHLRQVHGIGEQLICSLCGKRFRSKIRLDEHRIQCNVRENQTVNQDQDAAHSPQ